MGGHRSNGQKKSPIKSKKGDSDAEDISVVPVKRRRQKEVGHIVCESSSDVELELI